MEVPNSKNGVSVRAYQGDAMTLLAFDLDESKTENFAGFSVRITPGPRKPYYLTNLLTYPGAILKKNNIKPEKAHSTFFSPIQKFRWVHVPATFHQIEEPFYGTYKYEVTPRYMANEILQPLDQSLTVPVQIDVGPYKSGDFQIGFTRGFVESQAYTSHFGNNNKVRPNKTELIFDISHIWLGWQARARIMEFLGEVVADNTLALDVFAFDLGEPVICDKLIRLGEEGRVRVLLDNSKTHAETDVFENKFEAFFNEKAKAPSAIFRGRFQSLAHSKVFIQKTKATNDATKVLTGSTNFSTNGLYINANHVIIFSNGNVATLYAQVFDASFSADKMKNFHGTSFATQEGREFNESKTPEMTIRFSPHTKEAATKFFTAISDRIN